jgi:hypothetical protein
LLVDYDDLDRPVIAVRRAGLPETNLLTRRSPDSGGSLLSS